MDVGTCLKAAQQFVEVFPEAKAFSVTILDKEKKAVKVHRPRCSKSLLLQQLPFWIGLKDHHFFIRPLLASVVLLDLDSFHGDTEVLVRLKPRALVATSKGNLQLWLTVPASFAGKTALYVAKELTRASDGDSRSAKDTQQGRMPGSRNAKENKGDQVLLLSSATQDMCQQTFLEITSHHCVQIRVGELVVQEQPPKCTLQKKSADGAKGKDQSAIDFKMCCEFFEANPEADSAQAEERMKGKFIANRGANQIYYEKLTIANARTRVLKRSQPPTAWLSAPVAIPWHLASLILNSPVLARRLLGSSHHHWVTLVIRVITEQRHLRR